MKFENISETYDSETNGTCLQGHINIKYGEMVAEHHIMTTYYTPTQFILKSLGMYPTLYSDSSYDLVRERVLDHIFNTIGNGQEVSDFEFQDYDFESARKYITDETLWYGYHEEDIERKILPNGKQYYFPKSSSNSIVCLTAEKESHPEIVKWIENRKYQHTFYPNFDKKYSTVWKPFFQELGQEWINEAIWFYELAQNYFNTDPSTYHYAFPKNDIENRNNTVEKQIKEFEHFIKDYNSYEEVSKAYELEYNGDTYDFLSRRWAKELNRIQTFIIETLILLIIITKQQIQIQKLN